MRRIFHLARSLIELFRVALIMPRIESARRCLGLKPLLEKLRIDSQRRQARTPQGRVDLRRAIRWLDSLMPGGGNCYRRVLLEIALDRGAAAEPFFMGFNLQEEKLDGHAWLTDESNNSQPFQVIIRL